MRRSRGSRCCAGHHTACSTWIEGPDGERESFGYYPLTPSGSAGLFGDGSPPSDAEVAAGHRGMLGRYQVRRFLAGYPDDRGPAGQLPCRALRGPYQWLLPDTVTADRVESEALAALGLPAEVVRDIVASSDPSDDESRSTTGYAYNVCGQLRRRFDPHGTATVVSDPDGRFRAVTDLSGVRTEQDYNPLGWPLATRRYDGDGNPIGEARRSYDTAGNLLSETIALGLGAFSSPAWRRR